jgi:hypothetical protein
VNETISAQLMRRQYAGFDSYASELVIPKVFEILASGGSYVMKEQPEGSSEAGECKGRFTGGVRRRFRSMQPNSERFSEPVSLPCRSST